MPNPLHMTNEEIIGEIRDLQRGLVQAASRMQELCKSLLERSRREGRQASATPIAAVHVVYANAWARVAGLVQQSVRRNASADRMVDDTRREIAAEQERLERDRRRQEQREARERESSTSAEASHSFAGEPSEPSMDDLYELYGKELVDAR